MSETTPLVIFDLDGTLLHTGPDLVASLNHAIADAGLAPVELADLDHLVGQGALAMIGRAFALREKPVTEEETKRLHALFLDHYTGNMPGESAPYPGLVEALDMLAAEGFALAICTNKSEALTFRLLEALGLTHRFAAIVCGDTLPYKKPDGRHILATVERAGGRPETSIMIGDSVNDIRAAQDAGIASIAVPFGYSDTPVKDLDPDHVIDHYETLTPELIRSLFDRRPAVRMKKGG